MAPNGVAYLYVIRPCLVVTSSTLQDIDVFLMCIRLRDGIRHILSISALGNGYIQANKPWDLLKGSEADQ